MTGESQRPNFVGNIVKFSATVVAIAAVGVIAPIRIVAILMPKCLDLQRVTVTVRGGAIQSMNYQ